MTIYDITTKKRYGDSLTHAEISFVVDGFTMGEILPEQMSAFLMAVCINSMSLEETLFLTDSMMKHGIKMDLSSINGMKIDKHSTGGVGDKTTLIVLPIVASCGGIVPKMSGRGLGHTGGTIDKLESIPGFKTYLDMDEFVKIVNSVGCGIMCQTADLCYSDKKMYSLRDITATVESIPLIASSIMSKKLATGADSLVIDIKVGDGAFMRTSESALELSKYIKYIAASHGKKCETILSQMDYPLGLAIGNSLEVIEAIEFLKGNYDQNLYSTCMEIASIMLKLSNTASLEECFKLAEKAVKSGKALEKLGELIAAQGGNSCVIDDYKIFQKAKFSKEILAERDGKITTLSARKCGIIASNLGSGGRGLTIDPSAGILLNKTIGDTVCKNTVIATLYGSSHTIIEDCSADFYTGITY